MNNLFIPEPLREKDLTKTSSQFYYSQFDEALLYCVENTIYYTCSFDNPGKVLKERPKPIGSICYHDGHIYDLCDNKIFRDLDDTGICMGEKVFDICSHGNFIYDCGDYGNIRDTYRGHDVLEVKGQDFHHLVSHDYLYAASGYLVYRVPDGSIVVDYSGKETFVCDMCAYEDNLYIARGNYDSEFRKHTGSMVVSLKDPGESIATRDTSRLRLVVIDGVLYDIDNRGCLRDTLNVPYAHYRDKKVGYVNANVKKAITIPKDFLEELLL